MRKHRIATLACTLLLLVASVQLRAQAPAAQTSIQTAYASDAGRLSGKFAGLAGAMAGKYDWKPAPGVRSAGEVFNLIVMENKMLTGLLTGAPAPSGPKPEPITDPAKLQEALKASYADLQKAITGLSDTDLSAPVKMFGRDFTKQSAVMLLMADQHEHLGQSIAYARSNSVTPPWSK